MIMSDLSAYLRDRQRATLPDLSNRFDADPHALRGMLDTLERKGKVRRLAPGATCGSGCRLCDPAAVDIYEWVG